MPKFISKNQISEHFEKNRKVSSFSNFCFIIYINSIIRILYILYILGILVFYIFCNCWYWADRSPGRAMESYFPGWAYNYSYNFAETSKASMAGAYYGQFAKPARAQRAINLPEPYISSDHGKITDVCRARWPQCPTDALTNPMIM